MFSSFLILLRVITRLRIICKQTSSTGDHLFLWMTIGKYVFVTSKVMMINNSRSAFEFISIKQAEEHWSVTPLID